MSQYKISGVWRGTDRVITHYAFHLVNSQGVEKASKITKSQAIELLENTGNTAATLVWNYATGSWNNGEKVEVVSGQNGKYLRSNPDKQVTDNLAHLINF